MSALGEARGALDQAVSINRKDLDQWPMAAALGDLAGALDRLELEHGSSVITTRSRVDLERLLFEVRAKLEAIVATADYATDDGVDKSVNVDLIVPVIKLLADVTEGR